MCSVSIVNIEVTVNKKIKKIKKKKEIKKKKKKKKFLNRSLLLLRSTSCGVAVNHSLRWDSGLHVVLIQYNS